MSKAVIPSWRPAEWHLILLVIPELLAPSMALALRAAFDIRVCNSRIKSGTGSANAVAKRYSGSSDSDESSSQVKAVRTSVRDAPPVAGTMRISHV